MLCRTFALGGRSKSFIGTFHAQAVGPFPVPRAQYGKYFLDDHELPEPDAANRWFAYAESHGIDIAKPSASEDAATESGAESRKLVGAAGITIDAP